ncbi:MAG TPA: ribonuclease Y [Phycisphaerae bacterium]|nr:ribonuclease Y [Phycisphaerae bacterium]
MQSVYLLALAQASGVIAPLVLGALVGAGLLAAVVYVRRRVLQTRRQSEADQILEAARAQADAMTKTAELEAKAEYSKWQERFQKDTAETRIELKELEKRLAKREDNLEGKLDTLTTKERNIEQRSQRMLEEEKNLKKEEKQIAERLEEQRIRLLEISGMTANQARDELMSNLEQELEGETSALIERSLTEARDTAAQKVRDILVTAIQRYAAEHTCDITVSTVDIPSDDMKGRVIGREGRNIRAFEKATGVDVIVDDTPGVVVVSAFDPIRRETARLSLERLIQDGRIHPGRIEEIVDSTRKELEKQLLDIGKKAAVEANVSGLHRKQLDLLGRLKYRTSYGQNVLQHSIEVAYLCQIMADELGLDGRLARRCGLLHDIGKAVDHEVEGGHPKIGADICRRLGEKPEVLNAIAGHHGDIDPISPYTPLVTAGDAISASRPGGRRESLERYIQRLEQLEGIAKAEHGVKQAYAIQAGREIRVIVDSDRVDDGVAAKMARDIAKSIELQMTYPGEVKVTVLREMRAVEYAR